MRRFVLTALAFLSAASPVLAQDPGGAAAPGDTITTSKAGGVTPGAGSAPVARLSARALAGRPRIRVRFEEPGVTSVTARIVVLRSPGNSVVAQIPLGRVGIGSTIAVPWRGGALAAGRYVARVHAHDQFNHQLRRSRGATGKAAFTVTAKPAASTPPPSSPPPPPPTSAGVFPVAGPVTYGSGFGEDRGDHFHQGQDMAAAAGTPVVAPFAGTVAVASYQAAGAGQYVVLNASNGRTFFFAHCQMGLPVEPGQSVGQGATLCRVGSTGRSSGPHLHFEEWVNGWRVSAKSTP
ncbi:MAG: M23 family metallopeptidase, partial [Solirubrobacteraceae bacterium]